MKQNRRIVYIASCSGGKDSVAMVLWLIENGFLLDLVLFVNLGAEFPGLYAVIEQVKEICLKNGIAFREIRPDRDFFEQMLKNTVEKRDGSVQFGSKWCGGTCRWGTALKMQTLNHFYKKEFPDYDIIEYVGIAYDERERCERNQNSNHKKMYPLVNNFMKERDCLAYCYERGIEWLQDGKRLYNYFDHLSCWCCRNKNLKELHAMYVYFPEMWQQLKNLQAQMPEWPFYKGVEDIEGLELRFDKKDMIKKCTYDLFSLCDIY